MTVATAAPATTIATCGATTSAGARAAAAAGAVAAVCSAGLCLHLLSVQAKNIMQHPSPCYSQVLLHIACRCPC